QAPYYDRDNYKANDAGTDIVPKDPNLATISPDYYEHNWNMVFSAFHLISKTDYIFKGYRVFIDDGDDIFNEKKDTELTAKDMQYMINYTPKAALEEMKSITGNYFYDFNGDGLFSYSDFSYRYALGEGNDAGTATIIPQAMVGEHVHFVAVWAPGKLNITFDHNGGTATYNGTTDSAHTVTVGSGKRYIDELPGGTYPTPTKHGAQFAGSYSAWRGTDRLFSLSADNLPNAVCTFGQDTTFYADYTYCNFVETSRTNATCTTAGTIYKACDKKVAGHENCNQTTTETIEALGHNYTSTVTKQPTCEGTGTRTYTCSRCSDSYTETIAATGHKWDNGVVTTQPTCTTAGVKTYTCQNNSAHTKTDPVAATGHNYTSVVISPTCTEKGYTVYTCTNCKHTYTGNETAALGHSFTNYKYNGDANCTTDGTKTSMCVRCDVTDTQPAPNTKYGHNIEYQPKDVVAWKFQSCEKPYIGLYCCTNANCDAHEIVDGVLVRHEEYWDEIPGSTPGHIIEKDAAVAATCTETGLTEGKHCTRVQDDYTCNYRVAQQVTSALGHDWGEWRQTKAPTLYEKGEMRRDCARCDHYESYELDMLTDTVAPTGTIEIQQGNKWTQFLSAITFGIYTNDKYVITITAQDEGLGVDKIEYYKSETELTKDEIQGDIPAWATYASNAKPTYTSEGKYIVYAKITDKAGNITYISTNGLV
ncbi:MAG: hypothetical protein IKU19_05120, partial [Clostridia bacterium]|nr:hypothetical protein [Clostridia bacterium]